MASHKVSIADGLRSKRTAVVNEHNAIRASVSLPELPPSGSKNRTGILNQELVNSAGENNMNVAGSLAAPLIFSLKSSDDYDIYIRQITILIAATSVVHNKFGNVNILPNGWDLELIEGAITTSLMDKAQTSGQVIMQAGFSDPFGSDATSFQLTRWTGNEDAHLINIPIFRWLPSGLRIGRGTTDRLSSIINDSLIELSEFKVRAFGYKHLS